MRHQAKKRYGQNFLRDKNLLNKIVKSAEIDDKDVIEIGPGQGALTSFIAETAKSVIAFEIDRSLKPILDTIENKYQNLKIVYEDFMSVNLTSFTFPLHVVANVPYYITTPILFKILETNQIKTATMMIQKEVADRLLAKPKTPAYNALSIVIEALTITTKTMDVKRHMFTPVPNVDSIVIKVIKREQPLLDSNSIKIVKGAFVQKRKTLVNNWHHSFNLDKQIIEDVLQSLGYLKNIRAEHLSLEDFLKIINTISTHINFDFFEW